MYDPGNSLLWKLLNRSIWELFGLVVAILVMAWLIVRIRSLLTKSDDPADGDHELLVAVRDLRREGNLSDDEYRSIKGRLVTRLGGAPVPPNKRNSHPAESSQPESPEQIDSASDEPSGKQQADTSP